MKYIIATILAIHPAIASAGGTTTVTQGSFATCFHKVPQIAHKLGVKPAGESAQVTMLANGCDGKSYDLFLLISALIDKMDRASKK